MDFWDNADIVRGIAERVIAGAQIHCPKQHKVEAPLLEPMVWFGKWDLYGEPAGYCSVCKYSCRLNRLVNLYRYI